MIDSAIAAIFASEIKKSQVNDFGPNGSALGLNLAFGDHNVILVKLTIAPGLEALNTDTDGVTETTQYSDGENLVLVVTNHGSDVTKPVLVHLAVENEIVVANVYTHTLDSNAEYGGHIWFGNIKFTPGAPSFGAVEVFSAKQATVFNRASLVTDKLLTSYVHFVDGFTMVIVSTIGTIEPAFFRFSTIGGGTLENLFPTTIITPLGIANPNCPNFHSFGHKTFLELQELSKNEKIVLQYAFRYGVGSFNLDYLKEVSKDEVDPSKFSEVLKRNILRLTEKGYFTCVDTFNGEFFIPSPVLYLK